MANKHAAHDPSCLDVGFIVDVVLYEVEVCDHLSSQANKVQYNKGRS